MTGTYDLEAVHAIVNTSHILHVAFNNPDSPFPAVLPMIGTMASFERPSAGLDEPLDLYLHGYISSRLMQAPVKAASASSASQPDMAFKGLPITMSAAFVYGLVLSLTPNSHSYNYRSAILFGHALPVTDIEEKLFAMEKVTNSVVPGRWKQTRLPPTRAEMSSTQILRVKIESASVKVRQGEPHDDKADLESQEVTGKTWTGVVPMWTQMGEPVSVGGGKAELPENVSEYVKDYNEWGRETALMQTVEPAKKEKNDEA